MSRANIRLAALFVVASISTTGCIDTLMGNEGVIAELRADPHGERAQAVMILTLPSGRTIPINYLRDGNTIYGAADFPWWRALPEEGGRGTVFVRGETLGGVVRAVEDDETLRDQVFDRLRPSAPRWLGTLIVVDLD